MGTGGRVLHDQAVHFLRKSITFSNNGQTVNVGYLPAGATIIKPASGIAVTTVFNGDTDNFVDIGLSTDSGTNNYATQLTGLGLGFIPMDEAVSGLVGSSDVLIQALVTSTASASTGAAEIIICYVPDTDS
jgi:hypothetical protein